MHSTEVMAAALDFEGSEATWLQFCKERQSQAMCPLYLDKMPYYQALNECKHPWLYQASGIFMEEEKESLTEPGSLSVSSSQS